MVDVKDIVQAKPIRNRSDLESWFNEFPHDSEAQRSECKNILGMVAWRATMRRFPEYWSIWLLKKDPDAGRPVPISSARNLFLTWALLCGAEKQAIFHLKEISKHQQTQSADVSEELNAGPTVRAATANLVKGLLDNNWSRSVETLLDTVEIAAGAVGPRGSDHWADVQGDASVLGTEGRLATKPLLVHTENFKNRLHELAHNLNKGSKRELSQFWLWWVEKIIEGFPAGATFSPIDELVKLPSEVWADVDETLERVYDTWANHLSGHLAKRSLDLEGDLKRLNEVAEQGRLQISRNRKAIDFVKRNWSDVSESCKRYRAETEGWMQEARISQSEFREKYEQLQDELSLAKEQLRQFDDQLKAKLESAEEALKQRHIFSKPIELWEEKQREHSTAKFWAFIWFLAGLIVTAGAMVLGIRYLINSAAKVEEFLMPLGCDAAKVSQGLCSGFGVKGVLFVTVVLTFFTLLLWVTRIKMKEYLSERHLYLDARERVAFAGTYIELLASGDGASEEVRDQRAIVYSALFRPSSDGLVKDEGGLGP